MGQAKQPVNDGRGVKRSNRLNAGYGILTMMYIVVLSVARPVSKPRARPCRP
jgi:hypothetical protein